MPKIFFSIYIFCFLFFSENNTNYNSCKMKTTGKIIIELNNIQKASGHIRLALYDSEKNFMDEEKAQFYSFKITEKGIKKITLENIKFGEYAIAVFHDENSNEKLETNLFGIPTEPYCFSGSGHSKWRPPVFEDAKFSFGQLEINLSMQLEKWKL